MSGMIDRRIASADRIVDQLTREGRHRMAQHIRGIRTSLSQFKAAHREIQTLRGKLTPIGRAIARETRRPLDDELRQAAAVLERMGKIADTGGEGSVGVEAPDAAYLVDLLRRAAEA